MKYVCIHPLLPQKDPGVERTVRFVGYFASTSPPDREDESLLFLEALMGWLLSLVGPLPAIDKSVRSRACQLLAQIVNALPVDAALDEVSSRGVIRLFTHPAMNSFLNLSHSSKHALAFGTASCRLFFILWDSAPCSFDKPSLINQAM